MPGDDTPDISGRWGLAEEGIATHRKTTPRAPEASAVRSWLIDLGLITLIVAVLGGAWLWWLSRPTPARHLVVFVFDTLRADRMSVYGHGQQTTPFFEQISGELLRYADVKAPAPWTVPSHASMFTGLWPAQHGAQWGHIYLGDEFVTLAEVLRDSGFYNFGYSANLFLSEESGLIQGFEAFETVKRTRDIMAQLPAALDQATASGRRMFLFVNLMDTHLPFNVYHYGKQFGVNKRGPVWAHSIKWRINAGTEPFDDEQKAEHRAAYDAAVRYLDDVAQDLVGMLRDRALLDETLLVFTSDHGEGLGWHPEIGHSISAWEEQLDVPLLVRLPHARRGGLVFEPTTTLTALMPSALDWLGVARPPHLRDAPGLERAARAPLSAEYRSYFSELGRQSNVDLADAYPELAERVTHLHILYCDQYKLMIDPLGGVQLYDLATDPMEQHDLAERQPARLAKCEARYEALATSGRFTWFDQKADPPGPDQVDPDRQLETLRSLGYIE